MSYSAQPMRSGHGAPRHNMAHHCGQTQVVEKRPFISNDEMEKLASIQMQHAASRYVTEFLKKGTSGWRGVETEVGGEDDRRGIDFHLLNDSLGVDIPVDFSLGSKGGFAVKLDRDWFSPTQDGSFSFRECCRTALFRAFLPAMDPNNKWDLLGWKLGQKA